MSPEILHGILSTVSRLELTLDELEKQLRVLEEAGDLSSEQHGEPVPQQPQVLLGAANYQKSVQRLRQLYQFDSHSTISLAGGDRVGDHCKSMSSLYSSRPLSTLEIDTFLADPQVHPTAPSCDRECSNTYSPSSASSRISTSSADTHVTKPSSLGSSRRLSLDNAFRVLKGGDSRLRGLWKSFPTRSLSPSRSDTSSSVVISQETPTGLCYDDTAIPSLAGDDKVQVKTDTMRQSVLGLGSRLGQKATGVKKNVVVRVNKVAFGAGRALMDQQLRMLESR